MHKFYGGGGEGVKFFTGSKHLW